MGIWTARVFQQSWWENRKVCLWNTLWQYLKMSTMCIPYDRTSTHTQAHTHAHTHARNKCIPTKDMCKNVLSGFLTVAKNWKQTKCLLAGDWMNKLCHPYNGTQHSNKNHGDTQQYKWIWHDVEYKKLETTEFHTRWLNLGDCEWVNIVTDGTSGARLRPRAVIDWGRAAGNLLVAGIILWSWFVWCHMVETFSFCTNVPVCILRQVYFTINIHTEPGYRRIFYKDGAIRNLRAASLVGLAYLVWFFGPCNPAIIDPYWSPLSYDLHRVHLT